MHTVRRDFLARAAAGALTLPLLARTSVAAAEPVSYDSRLMNAPKFVDVDGIRTRYFEAGRGPALVLIQGGQWPATASADGFAPIFDLLAASYHVYAFDKLGMGFTDLPKNDADFSMDAIIKHAYGFIRAVGITRAIIAGHSRGGLPAIRIAADHPELATHLILFDSNALANDDSKVVARPELEALVPQGPPPPPPTRERLRAAALASTLSYNKAIVTDASVEAEFRIASQPKMQDAARRFQAAKALWIAGNAERAKADPAILTNSGIVVWWLADARRATIDLIRAGRVTMPTAIIWGYNDTFAPYTFGLDAMRLLAGANARTEMHFVNHAGHFVFAEQPLEVTRLINSFVRAYA